MRGCPKSQWLCSKEKKALLKLILKGRTGVVGRWVKMPQIVSQGIINNEAKKIKWYAFFRKSRRLKTTCLNLLRKNQNQGSENWRSGIMSAIADFDLYSFKNRTFIFYTLSSGRECFTLCYLDYSLFFPIQSRAWNLLKCLIIVTLN